jgi:D-beta-D-heptose 7-phosphate kinase/D-beta-D-heptose 1-phosphate adenosyltransferase
MLDEYLWGHIERISPEAPVPILNVVRRSTTLGGAANVVENLRSWGVQVTVLGVVGQDETGEQLRELLSAHGADSKRVVSDRLRKSTRKSRLMSLEHGQQVFRLDEESSYPLDKKVENVIIEMVHEISNDIQVILCSDYLKGVLSGRVLTAIFKKAYESGIRAIVAPKDSNPEKYRGANIVMANSRELIQLSGKKSTGDLLDEPARDLIDKLSLEALVVTRGGEGMSLFEKAAAGIRRVDIPTMARSVYDVTGAGDTAIAAFAAAIASGSDLEMAAHLANITAGIKVGKRGTASVSLEEIQQSLKKKSVGIQTSI